MTITVSACMSFPPFLPISSGGIQDLYNSLPPVYKHPVAGAQAHRGVAAADDGQNPQLAGDDGRVRQRRSHIGDNSRGTWEKQRPRDVRLRRNQNLTIQ